MTRLSSALVATLLFLVTCAHDGNNVTSSIQNPNRTSTISTNGIVADLTGKSHENRTMGTLESPEQAIRHHKQRRGRGKGRGKGRARARAKGKHRQNKTQDHSHIRRNLEKQVLVENRTLELLGGGGARILWTAGSDNNTVPRNTSALQLDLVGLLVRNKTLPQVNTTETHYDYDVTWLNPISGVSSEAHITEGSGLESGPVRAALGPTLARVLAVLKDQTDDNQQIEDPCEQWIQCRDKLEKAFLGPQRALPSCPCHYPSAVFYNNKIWDRSQGKHFRWRDVSGEAERLDVYKPGAAYCIRSLLAQGSTTLAAQHCCYDRYRKLLTRGSGAGTPDFISPEVSPSLHDKVDVLPWRLCKGDFTRYHIVRPPNNANNCTENPSNKEYWEQVQLVQYF